VVWPQRSDPRLRLALVIISLQVLGQTVLHFKLSIAQILVTIGVCALVDIAITYWRQRQIVWPASALLTGNSTAFILRANGTRPGDWWSLNGIEWFILAALIGILSKYIIRVGGHHLFNPSNLGLVVVFLAVGAEHVFPQYLYWGPLSAPVIAALIVIVAGAVWVLGPLRMWPMVGAFLVWFAVLVAAEAIAGRCFLATWHQGPVCGSEYWLNLVTSPELLVFTFFMISDPRTAPRLPRARTAYGILIAALAAALLLIQPSEFGIKVAILASLTVVCAFVPLFDRPLDDLRLRPVAIRRRGLAALAMTACIALAVPAAVIALASNRLVIAIDGRNSPSSISGPLPSNVPEQ
jgi:Na+-translocating ferredoxin:NAD+ oxidoreductase RnfD subunit